jgi:hypothetical protein
MRDQIIIETQESRRARGREAQPRCGGRIHLPGRHVGRVDTSEGRVYRPLKKPALVLWHANCHGSARGRIVAFPA